MKRLALNVLIGFAISAQFLGLVLALDVAGLRHLMLQSPSGWTAGFALFFLNGIDFAGVQFGIVVMRLAEDDTPPPPASLRQSLLPARATIPAPTKPCT